MRWTTVVSALATAAGVAEAKGSDPKRAPKYLTSKTQKFAVDGDHLPLVDFSLGESYAGSLPISDKANETRQLFYWFHPSQRPVKEKQIIIWLNGGPGCSSFFGAIEENGPLLWQRGVSLPLKNRWSWNRLADVIYIDQPLGTGLSPLYGKPAKIRNEDELAKDFMGFWKNFVTTFDLTGYEIYLTGESYAGLYLPYIAGNMLDAKDKKVFNVAGMLIYDGVLGDETVSESMQVLPFVEKHPSLMNINQSTLAQLRDAHHQCGYADFINKYMKFPAAGIQPTLNTSDECFLLLDYALAALEHTNPCFNIYDVRSICPETNGAIDAPGFFPPGADKPWKQYMDRDDVKKAIHAPNVKYEECADVDVFADGIDNSDPVIFRRLPQVIEATNKVVYVHGDMDFRILANGSLLNIQNMTWHNALGLRKSPYENRAYVPWHSSLGDGIELTPDTDFADGPTVQRYQNMAGAGYFGTWVEDRGLTVALAVQSGHELPKYQPSLALRHVEYLLGRIKSLGEISPSTIDDTAWPQPDPDKVIGWKEWTRRLGGDRRKHRKKQLSHGNQRYHAENDTAK